MAKLENNRIKEKTTMTETPVDDGAKPVVEPTAIADATPKRCPAEQAGPGVYAAFWQARSGFFHQTPK